MAGGRLQELPAEDLCLLSPLPGPQPLGSTVPTGACHQRICWGRGSWGKRVPGIRPHQPLQQLLHPSPESIRLTLPDVDGVDWERDLGLSFSKFWPPPSLMKLLPAPPCPCVGTSLPAQKPLGTLPFSLSQWQTCVSRGLEGVPQ